MTDLLFVLLMLNIHCASMDRTCLTAAPALTPAMHGYVTPYAPGLMESVFRRRVAMFDDPRLRYQRWGHLPGCLAALNDDHIGDYIIVWWPTAPEPDEPSWRLCYVVDVAQPHHAAERDAFGLILEVDYNTYARHGRGPVHIAFLEGS